MSIIPQITAYLRPGSTRRRLEGLDARLQRQVETLDAQVAALRTGLIRTFECADRLAPADLLTSPEDILQRLAAVEAHQRGQDEAWKVWREIQDRRAGPSAVVQRPAAAVRRQRAASAGLRVLDGGAR